MLTPGGLLSNTVLYMPVELLENLSDAREKRHLCIIFIKDSTVEWSQVAGEWYWSPIQTAPPHRHVPKTLRKEKKKGIIIILL